MDVLRRAVEKLPARAVATFIASGNVIFSSAEVDVEKLETLLGAHLEKSLGFAVDPAIRTRQEVAEIAEREIYPGEFEKPGVTIYVAFHAKKIPKNVAATLVARKSATDEFTIVEREVYWLCRIPLHESKIWNSPAVRALKLPGATMRNLKTVRKIAALYPPTL